MPVSHIRSQYGAGIQQEVINDVIRDTVFEAIGNEKSVLLACQTLMM